MKLGFIGLGAMGRAMAARLVDAGHEVHVWNRSPAPVDELVARGAVRAAEAADAARAPVVHTMLADDGALAAVLDEGGAFAAMAKGSVHVNHATVSLALVRRLAERHRARGIGYVAAPVFGRPDAAAAGKLHVLAAGAPDDVARVQPLLAAVGQRVWPAGDAPVRANVIKIAGNFMIAAAIEAMGEACALTRAAGVDAREFLDMMTSTLFAAPVYQGYGKRIGERRFSGDDVGFAMRLGYKDTTLTLAASHDEEVPMPLASVLRENFLDALAHGDGELDWSALADVAARRAHLDRRGR